MKKTILLLITLTGSIVFSTYGQGPNSHQRMMLDSALAPFYHGVASGDPLTDAVIIWTRITTQSLTPVDVDWYVTSDVLLSDVVKSGTFTTDDSHDWTVKVDVMGLQPGTYYYYYFEHNGSRSIIGRMKTAPSGDNIQARFAVGACASLPTGYFNAYKEIAKRNDIDAVIHLGDYIYENGTASTFDTSRNHEPPTRIDSLAAYRTRYSQYRLDPDLREAHRQHTWITTWDDHETANNAWYGGSDSHDDNADGPWDVRKNTAAEVYDEWLPIRLPDPGNKLKIWRHYAYGDLADLIVIDSRIYGREQQNGTGVAVQDTARTMLGTDQMSWVRDMVVNGDGKWKVICNQVMMAPLLVFGTAINQDAWDGYPAERKRIYDAFLDNNIDNLVVVTGDIHTSWANDLPLSNYNSTTRANSAGVEFVVTSITREASPIPIPQSLIQSQNVHTHYVDLFKRGYVVLDLTKDKAQADWYHISTVESTTYTVDKDQHWYVNNGERFLRQAAGEAPVLMTSVAPAPSGSIPSPKEDMVIVSANPNPFVSDILIQYYTEGTTPMTLSVIDIQGRVAAQMKITRPTPGISETRFTTSGIPAGNYILLLDNGETTYQRKLVKAE